MSSDKTPFFNYGGWSAALERLRTITKHLRDIRDTGQILDRATSRANAEQLIAAAESALGELDALIQRDARERP